VAPLLVNDLHIGYGQVGWLMGPFMLPGAVIAHPGGMLGRRFGARRLVLLGLALMTLGGSPPRRARTSPSPRPNASPNERSEAATAVPQERELRRV
jgi:MFS family permease